MCTFRGAKEGPSETQFLTELNENQILEATEAISDRVRLQVAGSWNAPNKDDSGAK
jgi:hypothetical protein